MHYGRAFMLEIDRVHKQHDYDLNFWTLSAAMGVAVTEAEYNSAVFFAEPVITLHPDYYYGEWSFTRFHELAHVVLRRSGIQQQLLQDADHPEQYRAWVEAYCNYGAAQFQAPNHLLEQVLRELGYTPAAIVRLASMVGVDLFDAMNRVTFGFLEASAHRTTVLTQGGYIRRIVTTDGFPHQEGDELPLQAIQQGMTVPLEQRFGRGRALSMYHY